MEDSSHRGLVWIAGSALLAVQVGGHNTTLNRILLLELLGFVCLAGAVKIKYFLPAGPLNPVA